MRIGILGSGLMGGKLGTLFARAPDTTWCSATRTSGASSTRWRERRARARARERRARRRRMRTCCCSPCTGVAWTTCSSRPATSRERSLVTCSLPMNPTTPGSSWRTRHRARRSWRRRRAARASSRRSAPSRARSSSPCSRRRKRERRPSLVYCGDNDEGEEAAATLIRDVGFDPVDAGPLEVARYTEPFTLLIAKLAYEGDDGPALAYQFEHYEERS